jgi:hypothetical protein
MARSTVQITTVSFIFSIKGDPFENACKEAGGLLVSEIKHALSGAAGTFTGHDDRAFLRGRSILRSTTTGLNFRTTSEQSTWPVQPHLKEKLSQGLKLMTLVSQLRPTLPIGIRREVYTENA